MKYERPDFRSAGEHAHSHGSSCGHSHSHSHHSHDHDRDVDPLMGDYSQLGELKV
mgnify:CR=1 FL=1